MKYDGILFDLDGTLWNATEPIAVSWAIALKDQPDIERAPSTEELEKVMGMTSEKLMAQLFPYLSYERGQELFQHCCEVEMVYLREHGGTLYPGLEHTLEKLSARHPLCIVSNCNNGYIETFLDAHSMRKYFLDWECIGRTGLQKWENIRLVVERNEFQNPVYVGDTELDYDSAERAGLPFIHAAYGCGQVPEAPQISSISELLEIV